jgi:flavin reductase (DIM6/NTAB) family NADH-FMN oxidoreductase RutF
MERNEITYREHYDPVMRVMSSRGLLLSAYDPNRRANAMTIGWGTLGSVWGLPMWTVLVRPSRYTYSCIEHGDCFVVNVPGKDLDAACRLLGTESGRDFDKLASANLTVEKGACVPAPVIAECPIVYECQVVYRSDVQPDGLAREIKAGAYASGDHHRVYFGKILSARAAADAVAML